MHNPRTYHIPRNIYTKDLKITCGNECCKNSSSEVPVSLA